MDFFIPKCLHSPGWKREGGVLWISSPQNAYTDLDGKGRGPLVDYIDLNGKGRGHLLDFFTPKCLHRPGWKREGATCGLHRPEWKRERSSFGFLHP